MKKWGQFFNLSWDKKKKKVFTFIWFQVKRSRRRKKITRCSCWWHQDHIYSEIKKEKGNVSSMCYSYNSLEHETVRKQKELSWTILAIEPLVKCNYFCTLVFPLFLVASLFSTYVSSLCPHHVVSLQVRCSLSHL